MQFIKEVHLKDSPNPSLKSPKDLKEEAGEELFSDLSDDDMADINKEYDKYFR